MLRLGEVIVNRVHTAVLEAGPASADEAVVFVHGNPGYSSDWEDLMERAATFCRCVAPDMPGFGQSARPEYFDYTVAGYADHLGALLTKLHIRKVHLVLHDFGGPWGLAWALAQPAALASLMLKHGNPRGLPKAFIDAMYDHFDAGTKRAVLKLYRDTNNPGEMAERYRDAFRALTCPTLVIWGRADPYLPARYAEIQRDFFPRAQVHVLDDSGHWPFADNPEKVAAIVTPFLRQAVGAAMGA